MSARRRFVGPLRPVVALSVVVLGLTACGDGPGSEEDLVNALTRDATFSQEEAECISARIFDEYGEDEEALGLISGTGDYEVLTGDGEGSVEGFDVFFSTAVAECS